MRGLRFLFAFLLSSVAVLLGSPSRAQITPDQTLGAESSILNTGITADSGTLGLIQGGATRGKNLFHSFTDFNIGNSEQIYFYSPRGIANIISRVTGSNASNINGLLGTFGESNAALILMNPNGIVFSQNSRLEVHGAFTATTAGSIQLGTEGLFSATEPSADNLLSIQPSAFFFTNLVGRGNINVIETENSELNLRVQNGESLLLLSRNLLIDGGQLDAWGGQIELVAVEGVANVAITDNGIALPDETQRGNIRLENGATVDVQLSNGGEIRLLADDVDILFGSQLLTGIESGLGTSTSQAGDLSIDATGLVTVSGTGTQLNNNIEIGAEGRSGNILINTNSLLVSNGAQLTASAFGNGNAGNVTIHANNSAAFDNSHVFSSVEAGAIGNGGNVEITTGTLSVLNGAQLIASTSGTGNAGNLTINADDSATFNNGDAFSNVEKGAEGNGGNVSVNANSILVSNDSQLGASTLGTGNAGNVTIHADDSIELDGGSVASGVGRGAIGNGGNVEITTGALSVLNGAGLIASTSGTGNAGNVTIHADNSVVFDGGSGDGLLSSGVGSNVERGAVGNGGSVNIQSDTLRVSNGAQLIASTFGTGNAGNVTINAEDSATLDNGAVFSSVGKGAVGNGSNVEIITGALSVLNGARLIASTSGTGNAGNVTIHADDGVVFDGNGEDGRSPSGAGSNVERGAVGNGGSVNIQSNALRVSNSATLSASTFGRGNAGNVTIYAGDSAAFDSGLVFSSVEEGAIGDGGNVEITTGALSVLNGAQLTANTSGTGNAGDVTIQANDSAVFDGRSEDAQFLSSAASTVQPTAVGNGGSINIRSSTLRVSDGATLNTSTFGQGNAGNVTIQADDRAAFDRGDAFSSVGRGAIGDGGNVEITAGALSVFNGGQLIVSTSGTGDAGNVTIQAQDSVVFDGRIHNGENSSAAFSSVEEGGQGNGGNVNINANSLLLSNGAGIITRSVGSGNAGNIIINSSRLLLDQATLSAESGAVDGGNINMNISRSLILRNNSQISATAGTNGESGNGGNINIQAPVIVAIPNENSDITANAFSGEGGRINLRTRAVFGLEEQSDLTPLSDITASSEQGVDGIVTLEAPDTGSVENSLTELSQLLIESDQLVTNSCIVRNEYGGGTLTFTGRDRLPQTPNEALTNPYPAGTVQTISSPPGASNAIIEPEAIYQLADGRLVMSRTCE